MLTHSYPCLPAAHPTHSLPHLYLLLQNTHPRFRCLSFWRLLICVGSSSIWLLKKLSTSRFFSSAVLGGTATETNMLSVNTGTSLLERKAGNTVWFSFTCKRDKCQYDRQIQTFILFLKVFLSCNSLSRRNGNVPQRAKENFHAINSLYVSKSIYSFIIFTQCLKCATIFFLLVSFHLHQKEDGKLQVPSWVMTYSSSCFNDLISKEPLSLNHDNISPTLNDEILNHLLSDLGLWMLAS